jgi:hypothetical protein
VEEGPKGKKCVLGNVNRHEKPRGTQMTAYVDFPIGLYALTFWGRFETSGSKRGEEQQLGSID